MPLAPWRSPLARALHRNRALPYARYVQLATVRPDGKPANRTVVFRNFLDDTNQLRFIVDRRSEKIEQIITQPNAEICWYFPKTREQFRIAGMLTLVTADRPEELLKARSQMWQELSDAARSQYAWAAPKQPKTEPLASVQLDAIQLDARHSIDTARVEPHENFCLLLLEPTEVDHLELRGDPQNRFLYLRSDREDWSKVEVNP
jgi:pyridoxamine 5'-phosphate oxidase